MAPIRRSFYGQVRKTAYDLWDGPYYLEHQDDSDFLKGGFCLLRLALRLRTSGDPHLEARSAYGYLAREGYSDAVLRAMSWDSKSVVRKSRDDPPPDAPFTIPAKFVRVSIAQVRQWINVFDGLQT
ncbi:MAG TPA: hypothetical protein VFV38_40480, partial [Ktedonobacteraceae bacterium]|nr:hypothetical protein [Ktedonobacteraceae bacterium]